MPSPVTARPVQLPATPPTRPVAAATPAPAVARASAGREPALRAQLRQTMNTMQRQAPAALQALDVRLQALLAQPGHDAETRALALLMRSGCAGLLAQAGIDPIGNGIRSYGLMKQAVAADPACQEAAEALGRSALTISRLDVAKRLVVTAGTGMDVKANARQAVALLAAFPNDAEDQLVRSALAQFVGDAGAKADADAHVARLAQANPRAVAAARADLGGDTRLAATVSNRSN